MKQFAFRLVVAAVVLLSASFAQAQDTAATRHVRSRWGNQFSFDLAWGSQPNLNRVLQSVGLPATRNFAAGFTLGWMYRPGRFEAGADIALYFRSGERDDVYMDRINNFVSLNAKYLIGAKNAQWYPIVGVGSATTINRITPEGGSTSLTTALTTGRNTTSLWATQGFASIGLGLRFGNTNYSFSGLEVGYRLGFAANEWSTRPRGGNMTSSVTDELRQVYVRLVGGGFKRKRR